MFSRFAPLLALTALLSCNNAIATHPIELYTGGTETVEFFIRSSEQVDWIPVDVVPYRVRKVTSYANVVDMAVRWRKNSNTIIEYQVDRQDLRDYRSHVNNFATPFAVPFRKSLIWHRTESKTWVSRPPLASEDYGCMWWGAAWNDKLCLTLPQPCDPDLVHDLVKPPLPRPKPKPKSASAVGGQLP